jgi:transposase
MSVYARVRARGIMWPMLQTEQARAIVPIADTVMISREDFERFGRMQSDLKSTQSDLKSARTKIDALNLEIARLKRWRFGSSSESLDTQIPLFDAIITDTAIEDASAREQLAEDRKTRPSPRRPVRQALPEALPRLEHHYELTDTACSCGQPLVRIGQDVSEQLDCVPARFFVHRHIRGKWACRGCQRISAAPLPAQIIDKGLPAPGLMAQVAVAKIDDHLPFYRQEEVYARSGVHIARSSMAQWQGIAGVRLKPLADALREFILGHDVIQADETHVALLAPGKGKTHRAYMWVYRTTDYVAQRAVWFDFCHGRGGEHPRRVLKNYRGTLVTDDYGGYNAIHSRQDITEAGCMAHARRKLFEVYQLNASEIARHAVALIAKLYKIEAEVKALGAQDRWRIRQEQARPIAEELHRWLFEQRQKLAKSDATAKAIDYSLGRWAALTHYLNDGKVPIDNNAVENSIRPLALGRRNWLFVGSQSAGERTANIMSLIESAKLCGHDPWAYLKDVFERLPTLKNADLATLLPHNWKPATQPADALPADTRSTVPDKTPIPL